MRALALTFAVAAGLSATRRAAACASRGCGDPTLTAVGVEKPHKNRVRVAVEERYGSLSVGEGVTHEHTEFLRSSLSVSWMPVKRLTIGVMVPWVTAWIKQASYARQLESGLGDIELAARMLVYQERGFAPHHL